MIAQFDYQIHLGEHYLLPSGRIQAISLLAITYLTSQQPDPSNATKWKYYAATAFIIVQVAWYEAVFIFPINRQIRHLNGKFGRRDESVLPDADQKTLVSLLQKWRSLHWVRVVLPLLGSLVSLLAII